MTSKEPKITKRWPRTLRHIISPELSIYLWRYIIDYESLTIGLTPFIVNEPGFVDWHIEKVTDYWVTFGAWW